MKVKAPKREQPELTAPTFRVALYTRQSVERSDTELTSCEAQRQAVEAYVRAQRGEGWIALPDRYDDVGFSGKDIERPAFQRLMREVEEGRVDVIAVYRFDRLSRSLLDFAALLQRFDRHGVRFISTTQSFDTSTSSGRLMVNLLATFAEFERAQIAERIRDKQEATRRSGHWGAGGSPPGYRAVKGKLLVDEAQAAIVRELFARYLELESLSEVAILLNRRGHRLRSGREWEKRDVARVLRCIAVTGRVTHGKEIFAGQHQAIVDQECFERAQKLLDSNRNRRGAEQRNKWGRLLRGLLHCARCARPMIHTYSQRGPVKRHYYRCASRHETRADACPLTSVSAPKIEAFVVDRLREIGLDSRILRAAKVAADAQAKERMPELEAERRRIGEETRQLRAEREKVLDAIVHAGPAARALGERVGEIDQRLGQHEARQQAIQGELIAIESERVSGEELVQALAEFDRVWSGLVVRERCRLLQLLLAKVSYHGESGEVALHLRSTGRFEGEERVAAPLAE
ncbi:MAG: recombinase family protein [Planctomycetes bacterium]|nr:recombinase family protein [Planctomycetota bacterium]